MYYTRVYTNEESAERGDIFPSRRTRRFRAVSQRRSHGKRRLARVRDRSRARATSDQTRVSPLSAAMKKLLRSNFSAMNSLLSYIALFVLLISFALKARGRAGSENNNDYRTGGGGGGSRARVKSWTINRRKGEKREKKEKFRLEKSPSHRTRVYAIFSCTCRRAAPWKRVYVPRTTPPCSCRRPHDNRPRVTRHSNDIVFVIDNYCLDAYCRRCAGVVRKPWRRDRNVLYIPRGDVVVDGSPAWISRSRKRGKEWTGPAYRNGTSVSFFRTFSRFICTKAGVFFFYPKRRTHKRKLVWKPETDSSSRWHQVGRRRRIAWQIITCWRRKRGREKAVRDGASRSAGT